MKSLKALFIILCCCGSFSATASVNLISLYPQASLFKHAKKHHQRFTLVQGPISYIENFDDEASEGYVPESSVVVEGEVDISIYDHLQKDSSLEVGKNMKKELLRKGFDITYECSGVSCGDVAGWQLYFSKFVDGDISSQYYVLAAHPDKLGGEWVIAFYVNEFTNIPRSILQVINTGSIPFDKYVIEKNALGEQLARGERIEMEGLLFDFGSDRIKGRSESVLVKFAEAIASQGDIIFSIEGHTDDVGDEYFNGALSLRRANAVKQFLVSTGINEDRLKTVGFGESKPVEAIASVEARTKNRRVEIIGIEAKGKID